IAANRFAGVGRHGVPEGVAPRRSREHNHCNVLCLGTDLLSEDQIRQIVEVFLGTPYVPGRHDRRVENIAQIEREAAIAYTTRPLPPNVTQPTPMPPPA